MNSNWYIDFNIQHTCLNCDDAWRCWSVGEYSKQCWNNTEITALENACEIVNNYIVKHDKKEQKDE